MAFLPYGGSVTIDQGVQVLRLSLLYFEHRCSCPRLIRLVLCDDTTLLRLSLRGPLFFSFSYSHPLALETANSNNRHNTYIQNQSRGRPSRVLIYILAMLVMDGNIEERERENSKFISRCKQTKSAKTRCHMAVGE